jgi:hypothetical protein
MDHAPLAAALASRNIIPLTTTVNRQGLLHEVIPGEMFEEDVLGLIKLARESAHEDTLALPCRLLLACRWRAQTAGPAGACISTKGADLALGAKLIQEHRCDACHMPRSVGGNGTRGLPPAGPHQPPVGVADAWWSVCNTELKLRPVP